MKIRRHAARLGAMATIMAFAVTGPALAGDVNYDATLTVNGDTTLVTKAPAPSFITGLKEVYSGWLFHDETTKAMQMDDFENPAMLFVDKGHDLWDAVDGSEGKSCASCHEGIESTKGLRASTPKVNKNNGELWSMEDYINDCRTNRMGAEAWGWSSDEMQSVVAAISMESRGMPVNVQIDGPAEPFWKQGEELYYARTGLLELSCASCHEQNYSNQIRDELLSQGQFNGFPVYRLKTTGLVSVHNRLKGCIRDTRAETYKEGSPELRALELYVASRGTGLSVEGVSVRP